MAGEPGERRGAHGSGALGRGHSPALPAGTAAEPGTAPRLGGFGCVRQPRLCIAPRAVQGIGGGSCAEPWAVQGIAACVWRGCFAPQGVQGSALWQ